MTKIGIGESAGDGFGEADRVADFRVRVLEESDALFDDLIDIESFGEDFRFGGELGEGADAAFERFHFVDNDRGGLFEERAVALLMAGDHLFDGEADRA